MNRDKMEMMNIEEIYTKFPNEWVILLDVKLDKNRDKPVRGRLVSHKKSRSRAIKELEKYRNHSLSFFYTGYMSDDLGALF